jgi:hypothetical protein
MYDLFRSGDNSAAMRWQFRILELFDAMLSPWNFRMGSGQQPSCADSASTGDINPKPARSAPMMPC